MRFVGSNKGLGLLPALCLAWATPAAAQSYPTYVYSERDGLPSGVVYSLGQESSGRMIMATRAGVASFDGRTWRLEHEPRPTGAPLTRLVVDPADTVFGTSTSIAAGLTVRAAGSRWETHGVPAGLDTSSGQSLAVSTLVAIDRERDGELERGVMVASRSQGVFEWFPTTGWGAVELPELIAGQPIYDCALQGERLALATGSGCWTRERGTWSPLAPAPGSPEVDPLVCGLAPAGAGESDPLWLVGRDWIGLYADGELRRVVEHELMQDGQGLVHQDNGAIAAQAEGEQGLWFGNRNRVAFYDRTADRLQWHGISTGLAANGANAILADLDRNTWITTHRGVTRISSRRFSNYDRMSGLLSNEVCAILEHPTGRMLLGQPGGLSFVDLATGAVETIKAGLDPSLSEMTPLLEMSLDERGVVWIAAAGLGLLQLLPDDQLVQLDLGPPSSDVHAVHVDRDQRVWIALRSQLYEVVEQRLVAVEAPFASGVRRITSLADGRLVILMTSGGAWIEEASGWSHLMVPGGTAQDNSCYAAGLDDEGRLLIGSLTGLYAEGPGGLERYPTGGTTITESVYSINRDREGAYWIGTQRGVFRWAGDELRHYGVHEGLPGLETNRDANVCDSTGAMWFGTVKGAARYRADQDPSIDRPPSIDFVSVEVNGTLRSGPAELELEHSSNDLRFAFRAISFRDSGEVEYRCRLVPYDPDWLPHGTIDRGSVRYTNLPAGEYRLLAQARVPGGRWGATASSARVRIEPPFWLEPWFVLLALGAVAAVGFGTWRLIFERQHSRRLQRQVELRTAELVRSQKLESLGLLAGGVAHDFNNLLTAVMAHADLARSDPARVSEHLDSIGRAADRGALLIKALLGYARRQETAPRPLDLNRTIAQVAAFVRPVLRAEIELAVRQEPELPTTFLDPSQVEQVLMNLVLNASDAMPRGGRIEISTRSLEVARPLAVAHGATVPAGRWVCLTVADTGIGMSAATAARLFDPFFTTKPGGRGTGLGLSTVHGIVNQNGGHLDFRTEPGRGTTFDVYLPAASADQIEAAASPEPRPSRQGLEGACVLVAEDDAMVRPLIAEALEQSGCRVLVARDAEEALALADDPARRIDLLITDVVMPGLSGPQLRERLLHGRPRMPSLFISGYTADEFEDLKTLELLPKPFTIRELTERARGLLAETEPAHHSRSAPRQPSIR